MTTPPAPPPGWYPDPSGEPSERYFDGQDWGAERRNVPERQVVSDEFRSAVLDRAVVKAVSQGGRVEYRYPFQAVIVYGKPVNHVLHAILSVFTCALWLIVWFFIAQNGGERREVLDVDPSGQIIATRAFNLR